MEGFHDPTVHVKYEQVLRQVAAQAAAAGESAEVAVAKRLEELREEFNRVGAVIIKKAA